MQKTNIGIDIKPTSISLVETAKGLFSHTLVSASTKVLPAGIDRDGIKKALQELITEHPPLSDNVKISLAGNDIIAQFARFPFAEKDELTELVKRHFEKLVPFPPEECVVDLDILGKDNEDMINVIIACARKNLVDDRISMLRECGMTPTMIGVDGLVLHKLYASTHKHDDAKAYVLLHSLNGFNTAVVVYQGMPLIIKDFSGFDPRSIFDDVCRIRDTAQTKEIVRGCDTVVLTGDYRTIVEIEHLLCTKRDVQVIRWNPVMALKCHQGLNITEQRAFSLALPLAIAHAL